MYNDVLTQPSDRNRVLLAACYGVVENFDLGAEPYKSQKKGFFPTQKILKDELMRRVPSTLPKVLRQKKTCELNHLLCSPEFGIPYKGDIEFIINKEKEIKGLLVEKDKEIAALTELSRGPNITNDDRLRYIEVMMSDDVKSLYRSSQDVLTRSGLDSRNSVMRIVDFYDKAVEVFNNPDFLPFSQQLADLHEHFAISKALPLKEYRLTRDKTKDILVAMRPRLAWIISKYELSGADT